MKRIIKTIIVCCFFTSMFATVQNATEKYKQEKEIKASIYETGVVKKVVDGDTVKVNVDGEVMTVRMIGIDTPESVHSDKLKNTPEGKIASQYTKKQLQGKTVYLTKDKSNKDKYDRYLRYIWIKKPGKKIKESDVKDKMFNAILVKKGYAYAKAYKPDTKYKKIFKKLQQTAQKNKTGVLWK